jgi:hypothetical protein
MMGEETSSAARRAIKGVTLKVHKAVLHGMHTILKDQVKGELLEFFKA